MSQDFNTLRIAKIVSETDEAKSIYFEVPEQLKEAYQFKAGQYLTLKFTIDGKEVRRAYSICVSPLEGKLGVNVKRVKNGLVSNYVNDHLKEGQEVEVMTPDGKFGIDLRDDYHRDFYFFTAGSGITPVVSMIKTILEEEPKSRIHLCYGNRNENSIIFKEEFDRLAEKYKGQFSLTHTLSKPNREKAGGLKGMFSKGKISWQGWQGRIDGPMIDKFLAEHPKQGKETHYFVCGPGAMIDTILDYLEGKGVGSDRLHSEHFSAAVAPSMAIDSGIASNVKVTLNGTTHEIKVPSDKTILDVLIDEKIDAPYSCTSGACSTCMGKKVSGEVTMDACYALDDSEVEEGYILVCQSRAVSPEVEITFDT